VAACNLHGRPGLDFRRRDLENFRSPHGKRADRDSFLTAHDLDRSVSGAERDFYHDQVGLPPLDEGRRAVEGDPVVMGGSEGPESFSGNRDDGAHGAGLRCYGRHAPGG